MRPNPAPREEALAFKSRGGFGRVFKATGYSLAGLRAAIVGEAAFHQLLALSAVLIPLACLLEVSSLERAVLLLVVFVALIVELLNSAIEAVVDRISLELAGDLALIPCPPRPLPDWKLPIHACFP